MKVRCFLLSGLALALVAAGVAGWLGFRELEERYGAYRRRLQPGLTVADVPVGWRTPEEARAILSEVVAKPYYRDLLLWYGGEPVAASPGEDLGLEVRIDDMVDRALEASHRYDYWQGFRLWLQGETITTSVDIPLDIGFYESAAARFLADEAQVRDRAPVEPMVDIQGARFLPGAPGRRLEVAAAAELVNQQVLRIERAEITLPVMVLTPDQSKARITSMLSTLVPVMEKLPVEPSFFTATLPISSTGGIAGTPLITYTGGLTWTFPHFAGYDGPLTSTYAYFFDLGRPGARFDLDRAVRLVETALRSGVTTPVAFEAEPVPPPPLDADLLIPALEARLAQFDGVVSLLVQDLATGEMLYDRNSDYVLSGMSVVKIGILVEVYRHFRGAVDAQTHQELLDMLGSSSCNPCANRLLAQVGGGSAVAGAQRVTQTMRTLGLANFRLCAPFRVVQLWGEERVLAAAGGTGPGLSAGAWLSPASVPRYDRCVKATPREMANLLGMIQQCTTGSGSLPKLAPAAFSAPVCQDMIDIMAANDLRIMLGAGMPAEVKLAHKHGFAGYDVPWGDTRAEVGIVFSPGATYLVSFYIWQDTAWIDYGIMEPLYRDVSNLLYNYFNAEQPYWPLPPWTPPHQPAAGT